MGNERNYIAIAEQFRLHAEVCRQFAEQAPSAAERARLHTLAERWERDAQTVLKDAELIERSRLLLLHVDRQLGPSRR